MEHIIIVRIESDRSATELVEEIQANLEYEGIAGDVLVASDAVRQMISAE
jgi:hypothetical protein